MLSFGTGEESTKNLNGNHKGGGKSITDMVHISNAMKDMQKSLYSNGSNQSTGKTNTTQDGFQNNKDVSKVRFRLSGSDYLKPRQLGPNERKISSGGHYGQLPKYSRSNTTAQKANGHNSSSRVSSKPIDPKRRDDDQPKRRR